MKRIATAAALAVGALALSAAPALADDPHKTESGYGHDSNVIGVNGDVVDIDDAFKDVANGSLNDVSDVYLEDVHGTVGVEGPVYDVVEVLTDDDHDGLLG